MAIFSKLYEVVTESANQNDSVIVTESDMMEAAETLEMETSESVQDVLESLTHCNDDMIMLQEALMIADITIDEEAIEYVKEATENGSSVDDAKKEASEKAGEKSEEVKKSFGEKAKMVYHTIIEKVKELAEKVMNALRNFFKAGDVLKAHPELESGDFELNAGLTVNAALPDLSVLTKSLLDIVHEGRQVLTSGEPVMINFDKFKADCKMGEEHETKVDKAFVKECVQVIKDGQSIIKGVGDAKEKLVSTIKLYEDEQKIANPDIAKAAHKFANDATRLFAMYTLAVERAVRLANATLWKVVKADKAADKLADKIHDGGEKASEKRQNDNAKEADKLAKENKKKEEKEEKDNMKDAKRVQESAGELTEEVENEPEAEDKKNDEEDIANESTSYSDLFEEFLNGKR